MTLSTRPKPIKPLDDLPDKVIDAIAFIAAMPCKGYHDSLPDRPYFRNALLELEARGCVSITRHSSEALCFERRHPQRRRGPFENPRYYRRKVPLDDLTDVEIGLICSVRRLRRYIDMGCFYVPYVDDDLIAVAEWMLRTGEILRAEHDTDRSRLYVWHTQNGGAD